MGQRNGNPLLCLLSVTLSRPVNLWRYALLCGKPLVALTGNLDLFSLGYIIDLLVSLGISLQDIVRHTLI